MTLPHPTDYIRRLQGYDALVHEIHQLREQISMATIPQKIIDTAVDVLASLCEHDDENVRARAACDILEFAQAERLDRGED